ncbi:hypothetical protein [Burkholderia gladioli]|uniref:hypothetical protein n=1 Tax=Burkholderia gladioli TaxID=28095 RepID=UPI00163E85BD|nr:hypothetical protein [Burkholderia gladioli]
MNNIKTIALLAPALLAGSLLTGCVAYPANPGYGGGYGGGYAAQPAYVQPGVAVDVNIGWHGDRYWDGRRYWARDDWNRAHPPGDRRYDDRDHRGDDHRDDHRW